jgi:3-phosphoshikimate 1-carboxyvinyltransferase
MAMGTIPPLALVRGGKRIRYVRIHTEHAMSFRGSGALDLRGRDDRLRLRTLCDTESTIAAMRSLGSRSSRRRSTRSGSAVPGSVGSALRTAAIDCGNAGTLMRLLAGVLAGQEGRFELIGDASRRPAPMERIAEPLRRMGGIVGTTEGFRRSWWRDSRYTRSTTSSPSRPRR